MATEANVDAAAPYKLALALCAIPITVIWRGFALQTLWTWFAVAPFGLPVLTLAQACGLSLLIGLLVYRRVPAEQKPSSAIYFADALFVPAYALFLGMIVKGFL